MNDGDRKQNTLLVVEDDIGLQRQIKWCLGDCNVVMAGNREDAIAALRRQEPQVVLQDLGLPPEPAGVEEGFACLVDVLRLAPHVKVVVLTGHGDHSSAVRAIGSGAWDFYQKPLDGEVLRLVVARAFRIASLEAEHRRLRAAIASEPILGLVAASEEMLALCRRIEKVAPAEVSVLLLGESGTGKEVIARALHRLSNRRDKRFVAINCAAIPETLLESELFGHERGAFTGATRTTSGKVELANGGTLFLDEIGDMALSLQGKLLRFLQERVIERVGGRTEIPLDVRVVCATNHDLDALIESDRFRADLYYRVSEVTLTIPALRERRGCIPVLAQYLLSKYTEQLNRPRLSFSLGALEALDTYAWPGNVRELENKIKSAVVMCDGPMIGPADLTLPDGSGGGAPFNLRDVRNRAERAAVRQALATSSGNITKAAELLGISRPTLYAMIDKLGLDPQLANDG
jgi:two-component system, NtrC family, response regulator